MKTQTKLKHDKDCIYKIGPVDIGCSCGITQTEHTPLPWRYDNGTIAKNGDGYSLIAITLNKDEERRPSDDRSNCNARFIVQAVNNHENLLTTLKAVRVTLSDDENYEKFKDLYQAVDKAINNAENAV